VIRVGLRCHSGREGAAPRRQNARRGASGGLRLRGRRLQAAGDQGRRSAPADRRRNSVMR
jgi:hypothetical protein